MKPRRRPRRAQRLTRATVFAIALAVGGLAAPLLRADTVKLRDGTVLTGTVKQVEGGYDFTVADGTRRYLKSSDVKSVSVDNDRGKLTPGVVRERLQSLERSVESERDINRIIDRYQQFIQMNADTEAATLAQADMLAWQQKRDAGQTIHYGRDWVTPAERDQRLVAAAQHVTEIAAAMTANKLDEAAAAVHAGLEEQPDNVSYLYLNGVLAMHKNQLAEAKRNFDQVEQQIPTHPPTLLNQASLAAAGKRWPQATQYLDGAIVAAPNVPQLVDAVNEFIGLIPEANKRTPAFDKLMRDFEPQEAAREQSQATHGLYRYGSQWVDKAALDKAKADRDAFDKSKADLEAQFATSADRVRQLDQDAASTQRIMQQMQVDSVVTQPDGTRVNRGLPPAYWDAVAQLEQTQQNRKTELSKQADLRRKADDLKKTEPHPPVAGFVQPIGEVGVPILLPAQLASTQPTTEPTTQVTTLPGALIPASNGFRLPDTTQPATGQPTTMP